LSREQRFTADEQTREELVGATHIPWLLPALMVTVTAMS
jgi:hypothetical protein